MKKENWIGLGIYLLVFAVAIVYGLTVLRTHFDYSTFNDSGWIYALYIVVTIVSGILITGLLQEFGHFLGAKVGGYKILSWCFLYFTIYKDGEKTKVGFRSYDGLTGETKIIPNYEKKEQPNPYPYLLYGSIFNSAWIAGCLVIFFTYKNETGFNSDLAYYFLTMGLIALFSTLYNIIPVKLDSNNDGYRLFIMKKDVAAFNQSLLAENNVEGVEVPEQSKQEDVSKFIPEVILKKAYEDMNNGLFDEADKALDELLENEKSIPKRMFDEIKCQKLFLTVLARDIEVAKKYYDELPFSFKKDLSNSSDLPSIRAYMLSSALIENSKSECLLALSKVVKAYKNTPTSRRELEASLYNKALDKIIDAHPKWEEIPNYRIVL